MVKLGNGNRNLPTPLKPPPENTLAHDRVRVFFIMYIQAKGSPTNSQILI